MPNGFNDGSQMATKFVTLNSNWTYFESIQTTESTASETTKDVSSVPYDRNPHCQNERPFNSDISEAMLSMYQTPEHPRNSSGNVRSACNTISS